MFPQNPLCIFSQQLACLFALATEQKIILSLQILAQPSFDNRDGDVFSDINLIKIISGNNGKAPFEL